MAWGEKSRPAKNHPFRRANNALHTKLEHTKPQREARHRRREAAIEAFDASVEQDQQVSYDEEDVC
jgi:hypothetical protein